MPPVTAEAREKAAEAEKSLARAQATIEAYPNGLTADKMLEVRNLIDHAQELKAAAGEIQKLADVRQDMADVERWLHEPQRQLAHGLNGDDDDRTALQHRGWESKGGLWYAPTSLGVLQAMYPIEVLTGPIPDDPPTAAYVTRTRAAMGADYKQAWTKHTRAMARHNDSAVAWGMLTGVEQKALSEGSDPDGGFLVPPDAQAEVLARTAARSVIRRYARVVTTSRDVIRFPAVNPNTTAGYGSIYSSGFVGTWVGETPAWSETDPGFQLFEIPIRKARVATKLSNDFIADSSVDILAWLASNGGENLALVEDQGFVAGTGGGLQPTGLLNAGISTVDVEGTTSNTISNTAADAGSSAKLITLAYALPAQYAGQARWLMKRSIEASVRKLISAVGQYHWLTEGGAQLGPTPRSLLGYPVENSDFMQADGTDANKVLLFGDLSQYIIAQRQQLSSIVLRERFADTDQTGIVLFERVGGGVWNIDAFRIGIV